jgi:Contractile injection system tube protein
MLNPVKGFLIEYAVAIPPLVLAFEFNPQQVTRNRSVNITLGSTPATRGGFDFLLPSETPRVAQGVSVEPESFDVEILLDATDRMNDSDEIARTFGVEPELSTLRSMVEPKTQGPGGVQMLASLGLGGSRAFQRNESASVLLFVWGTHVLPVFLKAVDVTESAHLPSLVPYRATVKLTLQVIEGNNPFYLMEKVRQTAFAAMHTGQAAAAAVGGLL